jgi:hypothetical protein
MNVVENNLNLPKEAIFNLNILNEDKVVGNLTVYEHPNDKNGGQVHIEIVPKWRCRWVSRGLKQELMSNLINIAKEYKLKVLYSTAFAEVSPRLLAFAGFIEYNRSKPKTYYYLMI